MFRQLQQTYQATPELILTPFFPYGSTYPSYHIKPVYNDIESPQVKDINNVGEVSEKASVSFGNEGTQTMPNPELFQQQYYQNYMNTVGSLVANIGMQPHTHHTNQMGQQYMYPTMPYYIPATKVGERVLPVVYQPNSIYSQNTQTRVTV